MRRRFLKDKTSYDFSSYMTFEVLGDGFQFKPTTRDVEYSCNGGGWEILSKNKYSPSFMVGDFVSVKCVLERYEIFGPIYTNGRPFNLRGNALSLIYGDKTINNLEDYPYVFRSLFSDAIGLRHVEKGFLPATSLSDGCYEGMFFNSTIVTAPELPATTLASYCYAQMYQNCSSLNYIKMLATDISAYKCLSVWVQEVASSGTFVKNPDATWDVVGDNGVPSGWTVKFDGEEDKKTVNKGTITIGAKKYTITFDYPVTSDVRVVFDSATVTIYTGSISGSLPVMPGDEPVFKGLSPYEDDTYIYEIVQ